MAAKYDALHQALLMGEAEVSLTFVELDRLVDGLPDSARKYRPWWGNTTKSTSTHSSAWISAGYVVGSVDIAAEIVTFVVGAPQERGATSVAGGRRPTPILDGVASLEVVLSRAGYASTMHAVAAHTVFLHPETVAQTEGSAVFPIVRDFDDRGTIVEADGGRRLLLDDNSSVQRLFAWASGRSKGPDIQFNHVYSDSKNPEIYTALWNLCVTPAFLAKTTDGSTHTDVVSALRFRAFELYGHYPDDEPPPVAPDKYEELDWHRSPPALTNLEAALRSRLASSRKGRPARAAREIGWLFSDGIPDDTIPLP